MPRKYTKIKELEPEVFGMKAEGKTNREIAEHFGLTQEQIRELGQHCIIIVARLRSQIFHQIVQIERRRADASQAKFVQYGGKYASKRAAKGRPRKRPMSAEEEKDRRIAQLEMEVELLRDFLRLTGRR